MAASFAVAAQAYSRWPATSQSSWEKLGRLRSSGKLMPMGKSLLFGPFRLNPETGMLSGALGPIPLGVRGSALVRALVEARGTVVSKNALMDAAWPGMAVEESNLTVQIAAIRRVLGEGWIATAARQGYRITGPVTEHDDGPDSAVRATLAILPLDGGADGNERERFLATG